jgi:hypothetical protein
VIVLKADFAVGGITLPAAESIICLIKEFSTVGSGVGVGVLAAEFVIGIHLPFVLLLEVDEALEFVGREDGFDDIDCDKFSAVVLGTLNDVVPAPLVLMNVALHAVKAEGVSTGLLAETGAEIVADVAEDLGQILLDEVHLVLLLDRDGIGKTVILPNN